MASGGRRGARRSLVQALYQMQLAGHDLQELAEQFGDGDEYKNIDHQYFADMLAVICADTDKLDGHISVYGDIPASQIDPVEKAVMWVALAELESSADVPAKVVINEAVELAKTFGAEGGYRYVNGLLDKAAAGLR